MAYGVLPEGFALKPLTQIQADIVARLVASPAVGPSQDYSSTSPLGQIVGSIASEIAEAWELGFAVHTSGDPEGALGVPLDQLLSLNGSIRQDEAFTELTCDLTLDAGTLVPGGSLISLDGRPDLTFALEADVENESDEPADFPGVFVCTVAGPINVTEGATLVIDSAVAGWTAVTLVSSAPGRLVATDLEFRKRSAAEKGRNGAATPHAIRAVLLDTKTVPEFATIESVIVLDNKTDFYDSRGLPPHSYSAVIDDGESPTVDDDLIAQVLFERGGAGGIRTHGNNSGVAVDSEGNQHEINFARVDRQEIWIEISVETSDKFLANGADLVAEALVNAGSAYGISDDVIAEYIKSFAFSVAGVVDVTAFTIGLTEFPTLDVNIPMSYLERATFSVARVTVTATEA